MGAEGNPKDFSLRIGQKKEQGERRKGGKKGETERGERKEESLRNCSVRRSLFNQTGACQLSVACRKRKTVPEKVVVLHSYPSQDASNNPTC